MNREFTPKELYDLAEAEDILSHLPKLGIPMIMRKIEKGEGQGHREGVVR